MKYRNICGCSKEEFDKLLEYSKISEDTIVCLEKEVCLRRTLTPSLSLWRLAGSPWVHEYLTLPCRRIQITKGFPLQSSPRNEARLLESPPPDTPVPAVSDGSHSLAIWRPLWRSWRMQRVGRLSFVIDNVAVCVWHFDWQRARENWQQYSVGWPVMACACVQTPSITPLRAYEWIYIIQYIISYNIYNDTTTIKKKKIWCDLFNHYVFQWAWICKFTIVSLN